MHHIRPPLQTRRPPIIRGFDLKEKRFGFELEVTAKIANYSPKLKIFEIGGCYDGRTYQEGKKIGWKDGIRALYCIIKYNKTSKTYSNF